MNKEDTMFGQLAVYVPKADLEVFREVLAHQDAMHAQMMRLPVHPVAAERMFQINRSIVINGTAIRLLKKHTGKRLLTVYAAGRIKAGDALWPQILRIKNICQAAGPEWIIFAGGGPSGMRAARLGGKRGKSLVAASHFFSESAVQGKVLSADHTLDLFYPEFYSREFGFGEEADALVWGVSGYGGTGEGTGLWSKTQMKMHRRVPMFLLSADVHQHLIAQTEMFQREKLCHKDDDFFRVLDTPADDVEIFNRINAFYANRPYLADWHNTMTSPSDPFRVIPPDSGGVPTKTT